MQLGYADLHMHTKASDGTATVQRLMNYVEHQRPELDVIAITDHDTLDGTLWALENQHHYRFDVVPGVEVTSIAGHILGLWVTTPIPSNMDLFDTVAAIREAGGIAILAHPFHFHLHDARIHIWRYLREPEVLLRAGIQGIEAHNASMVGFGYNILAHRLAKRINVAVTGSSDAHTVGAVGRGVTRFSGHRASDLRQAIENVTTRAEGTTWQINDYIEYFRNERQRKGTISSASMIS